ncbi:RidA family protein [Streptomyces sp. GbtcB6]|uniref:RidA family protein n=1 Tax=Streptomyces sp. GbtcB6 TaxID=2824751 RepID=UPI001C305641|nr:Rid family hydrolase [Streptomyces sp. GbtcB6]
MPKQAIAVPVLSEALKFAPLELVTRAGDYVYISGLPPYSPETGELVSGDVPTQVKTSLAALDACLAAAGATKDDIVNVRIYSTNSGWFAAINEVYREYFGADGPFPSRTFVPVASWFTNFDIEIDCVVYLGD